MAAQSITRFFSGLFGNDNPCGEGHELLHDFPCNLGNERPKQSSLDSSGSLSKRMLSQDDTALSGPRSVFSIAVSGNDDPWPFRGVLSR